MMVKRTADAGQAMAAGTLAAAFYEQGGKHDDDIDDITEQMTEVCAGHDRGDDDTRRRLRTAAECGHPQADYYLSLFNGNGADERRTVIEAAHRWKRGA